eukprot:3293718-Rhodomonas_salina.3
MHREVASRIPMICQYWTWHIAGVSPYGRQIPGRRYTMSVPDSACTARNQRQSSAFSAPTVLELSLLVFEPAVFVAKSKTNSSILVHFVLTIRYVSTGRRVASAQAHSVSVPDSAQLARRHIRYISTAYRAASV